ncbi:MAG: penicillin acylase family protein, partial [Actinomycetota bacterium]
MMDVLRHTGRGMLTEFIGPSVSNLTMDCTQWRVAAYTDQELMEMVTNRPPGADQELVDLAMQDLESYVAGINAYIDEVSADSSRLPAEYPALQQTPDEWTISDTVAVASLIGGNLGVGGGNEIGNALFLNELEAEGFSPTDARTILEDLRLVDDPEAPSSTSDPFPYDVDLGPVDTDSVARPDDAPVPSDDTDGDSCGADGGFPLKGELPTSVDGPFGPIPLIEMDRGASNALLVDRRLSANGVPAAVFGPQVAYWSPEILMELDMHGPGLQARGVGFPGISLYVLLGRGDGYGYSATSASGDQVDTRAVELCEPGGGTATIDSDGYIAPGGACEEFDLVEDDWIAKPTAGSCPTPNPLDPGCQIQNISMVTERAQLSGLPGSVGLRGGNWGLVQSRGEVDGTPVAFVRQRVTYGGEVDSSLAYVEMMDPDRINGPEDFQRAFARFNFTFNWFYVDGRHIAFQLGGMHPVRAPNTDPDLPVWEAPEFAWQRALTFEETPKDIDPEKGYITSWN